MNDPKSITNPFPGLRPFETDEHRLFFGREGQSDALIARLQRSRLLAVVGTSGSGKSSLIRAGLLPALRGGLMANAGSGWRIAIMRPGGDPTGYLAHALGQADVLPEAGGGLPAAEAEAVIEATLRRGSLGLVDVARQGRLAEHEKLLVLVDQFEELFRFRSAQPTASTGDEAFAFVKLLLEAAQQRELSIYVVITMRSDFLGDCAQFQGLPEAINDGQYLIPRMSRDERRLAIAGPVGVTRGRITEPLVNRLLNDVGDNPDQLPILQHALMRTWACWQDIRSNGEPIGIEHYEMVGGMERALAIHATEAFSELKGRQPQIAEKLFKALTEKGEDNREIRRPATLGEICAIADATPQEVIEVIDVFRREDRSFLMPPVGILLAAETMVDISHESLIRNWSLLKAWVDDEAESARMYRRLADAAAFNNQLTGTLLEMALDWREQNKPTAVWAERYHIVSAAGITFAAVLAFIDQSQDARAADAAEQDREAKDLAERDRRELEQAQLYALAQRQSAQRLRRLAIALVLISLFALATAGASVIAFARAKQSETRAENLAGRLTDSLKEVRAANEDANRQRDVAQAEQKNANAAQKKAEDERTRADDAARLASQRAEDEHRAKEGLRLALAKSEAIKNASRFFRSALADWDRAYDDGTRAAAYQKFLQSINRFEVVGDYDGLAAVYLKLGYSPENNPTDSDQRKRKFYPKAVEYYRKSGNHAEAAETLASLAALWAPEPTDEEKIKDADKADRFYSDAYEEYKLEKPQNLTSMFLMIERAAAVYENLDDVPSKRKAIERYERVLALQAKHPSPQDPADRNLLIDLYRSVETPEHAEALVDKMAEDICVQQGIRAEVEFLMQLLGRGRDGLIGPQELRYLEKARQIYRQAGETKGEAALMLNAASQLSLRPKRGSAPKENLKKAIDYYKEALKIYEQKGLPEYEADTWSQIARCFEDLKQSEQIVEAYTRELALVESLSKRDNPATPKYADDYYSLIITQMEAGKWTQALETYNRLLKYYGWKDPGDAPKNLRQNLQDRIDTINEKLKPPQQPQP
jgi:tetratricopeptide (TPR) repeat protein